MRVFALICPVLDVIAGLDPAIHAIPVQKSCGGRTG
jgi:hypothetical protein